MGFDELGLSAEVVRAVADAGYEKPTPIQEQAIPYVLMGRDVLGCAQTGTGKTASFTLPMIDILAAGRAKARMPRSLIITPTRELATQIAGNFETYGRHHTLTMALLIGGVSFEDQIAKLDRGVDVLIATPGRLLDHFERGRILLNDIKILVIDEADRMMDMGFMPDVERIVGLLPRIRQTLFFSATIPPAIRRIAERFLINPKEITVTPETSVAETVTQNLVQIRADAAHKREALRRLIRSEDIVNAIVFCNRKKDVDILFKSLKKHGFNVAALHGDMPQPVRIETLDAFRDNKVDILVASDVAARGLDLPRVSHVFNFDVPTHAEDYVHRIGRTGRAGRKGRAFMIATPAERRYLEAVKRFIRSDIPPMTIEGFEPGRAAADDGEDTESRSGRRSPRSRVRKADAGGSARRGARKRGGSDNSVKAPAPAKGDSRKVESGADRTRSEPDKKPRGKPDEERAEATVVGMGSHVPAFMRRSVRAG